MLHPSLLLLAATRAATHPPPTPLYGRLRADSSSPPRRPELFIKPCDLKYSPIECQISGNHENSTSCRWTRCLHLHDWVKATPHRAHVLTWPLLPPCFVQSSHSLSFPLVSPACTYSPVQEQSLKGVYNDQNTHYLFLESEFHLHKKGILYIPASKYHSVGENKTHTKKAHLCFPFLPHPW